MNNKSQIGTQNLTEVVTEQLKAAKAVAPLLRSLPEDNIRSVLRIIARELKLNQLDILEANQQDLARMDKADPKYDRLLLNEQRIDGLIAALEKIADFPIRIGEKFDQKILPNGLKAYKQRVPLGVVGMIYEARPNVTVDAFAICFKTANVVCLKGGSDADNTNRALVKIIQDVLEGQQLPKEIVTLLPAEREVVDVLFNAKDYLNVLIPRGSKGLIDHVQNNSKVPVIETGAGVVHIYLDESADLSLAAPVINSAKLRRPSVCNALDCLIVHQSLISKLPQIFNKLADNKVTVYADEQSMLALSRVYPLELLKVANLESFGQEFLGLSMSVKTVSDVSEAIDHIAKYSSGHSEAIITESYDNAQEFIQKVNSACVFWNTETGFADGEQLGLGAEIGISTQMLHARGPMGLAAMTTYQWVVEGAGQVRT